MFRAENVKALMKWDQFTVMTVFYPSAVGLNEDVNLNSLFSVTVGCQNLRCQKMIGDNY